MTLTWPMVALVAVVLAFAAFLMLYRGWLAEMVRRRVASVDVDGVRGEVKALRGELIAASNTLNTRVDALERSDTTRALNTLTKPR